MEYVEGLTLQALLRQGPLGMGAVVEMGTQIADALDAAYARGIVHRDLKPANIFVTRRGQVKVLDFGLAKRFGTSEVGDDDGASLHQTAAGQIVGTPYWDKAGIVTQTPQGEIAPPEAIVPALSLWRGDPDLAGIRDAAMLALLPAEE
jgi:serine/threonine protein kinase